MNIDALVEVEPSIRPPVQGVDDVMGVLGAEAAEDDALLVGLAVAIGVGEVEQLGGLADVAGGGGQDSREDASERARAAAAREVGSRLAHPPTFSSFPPAPPRRKRSFRTARSGTTPVGMSKPSTKTVDFVRLPVCSGSSRMRILSLAACPGSICG